MLLRVAAFFLILPAFCAQAQYKWTERDGSVSYGDQPPRGALHVERLSPSSGASEAADPLIGLPFEIRRAAKDFPVVLYVHADCPPCDDARGFLKRRAIPFSERTVATAEDFAAYQRLGGGQQFPAVAIGRQLLRGYEPNTWSDALLGAGYPQGTPLPRNWQWPAPAPLVPPPAPAPDANAAAAAGGPQ
jgi:glutaredoxin